MFPSNAESQTRRVEVSRRPAYPGCSIGRCPPAAQGPALRSQAHPAPGAARRNRASVATKLPEAASSAPATPFRKIRCRTKAQNGDGAFDPRERASDPPPVSAPGPAARRSHPASRSRTSGLAPGAWFSKWAPATGWSSSPSSPSRPARWRAQLFRAAAPSEEHRPDHDRDRRRRELDDEAVGLRGGSGEHRRGRASRPGLRSAHASRRRSSGRLTRGRSRELAALADGSRLRGRLVPDHELARSGLDDGLRPLVVVGCDRGGREVVALGQGRVRSRGRDQDVAEVRDVDLGARRGGGRRLRVREQLARLRRLLLPCAGLGLEGKLLGVCLVGCDGGRGGRVRLCDRADRDGARGRQTRPCSRSGSPRSAARWPTPARSAGSRATGRPGPVCTTPSTVPLWLCTTAWPATSLDVRARSGTGLVALRERLEVSGADEAEVRDVVLEGARGRLARPASSRSTGLRSSSEPPSRASRSHPERSSASPWCSSRRSRSRWRRRLGHLRRGLRVRGLASSGGATGGRGGGGPSPTSTSRPTRTSMRDPRCS